MQTGYIYVKGTDFYVNGNRLILRGYGIGNWLNLEHFMLGLPGTDAQIKGAIKKAYGDKNARLFWEKYWECYVDEEDFRFMKQLGVNTVRIPFNYHLFESDQAPYQFDPNGFAQIDRVLKLCEAYQIYGILDLHAAPGGQNPDWHSDNPYGECLFWEFADFRRRVIALWKYIAQRYKDNPWVGAYDLLNEPSLLIPNPDLVYEFFTELICGIREVDQNHMMFVEGDSYATNFKVFKSLEDPNVACTFHFYPLFSEQEIDTDNQQESIEQILFDRVTLDDIKQRLGRPIWCGETGALFEKGDRAHHVSMLRDMISVLEKHGISWSLWSYKDARSMGTVHPKANSLWMEFSRNARKEWEFWDDFYEGLQVVDQYIEKYPTSIPDGVHRKLWYRILANYQLIITERYHDFFAEIPFDELMEFPESFRFQDCEVWTAITEIVRSHTQSSRP
jgi:endoglucanase